MKVRRALAALGSVTILGLCASTPRASAQSAVANETTIRLVSQTPFVEPTGAEFVLRFRVDNAPPDAELVFRLFGRIENGRNRFLDSIHALDKLGPERQAFKALPLANLPVDENGVVTARFAVDARATPLLGFFLEDPGVYPLVMEVRTGSGDPAAQLVTHVIRLPFVRTPANPAFAVSVVVPIRAPVAHQTDGSINLGPQSRTLTDRIDVLLRHPDVPVTLLPTPETLVALRDSGAVTAASLTSLAEGRQVLSSTYVDIDLASWIAAGSEMRTDLDRQRAIGASTTTELLGVPPERGTAVLDRSTSVDALRDLRSSGVQQVVVPESLFPFALPAREFPRTLTRTFEIEGPPGVRTKAAMADAQLAAHLNDTADPVLNAAHTIADLAILYDDQPAFQRGAVLQLPDDVSPAYLDALLAALDPRPATDAPGARILSAATVDGLFSFAEQSGDKGGQALSPTGTRLEPTLVRPWVTDPPAGLAGYPRQLTLAHASLASYRTLFADGELRVVPLEHLLLLSGARPFDERRKQDHLDAAVAIVEGASRRVVFPDQSETTLTDTEGDLRLAIENTGTEPLNVKVVLASDKLEVVDLLDDRYWNLAAPLVLEPGTNEKKIRVRARGSGVFTIDVTATSPDGALPMAKTTFEMRSTAVSGLGLAISIGAGIFLAIWWAHHIVTERRARRAPPGAPATRSEEEPVPVG